MEFVILLQREKNGWLFFIDEEATWGIYFNVTHDFLVQTGIQVDLLVLNVQQITTIRTLRFLNEDHTAMIRYVYFLYICNI